MLQFVLPVSGKSKTGFDILNGQLREVPDDFLVVHACSQPSQYIINGYPGISDTWFSKTFVRIPCNDISIFNHGINDLIDKDKINNTLMYPTMIHCQKEFSLADIHTINSYHFASGVTAAA
jgi:hypothetical protein